jgi:Leucine-rich repeat (LRR) protein
MARARHSMTYFLTMLLIFIVLSIISYLQKRSALVASTASTTTSTVPSSPSSFATGSNAHVTAQSNNHANANTVKVIDTRNGNGNVDGTCHQRTSSSASNNGGGQEGDSCIVSANDNNNNDSNDDNYIIIKKPYYGNDIISSQKTKTSKWTSESVLTTTTTTITHTPHGTYKHVFDYTDIKMDGNPNIEEIREVLDQHVENAIAGGETGISDEDYRMAKDKIIEQIDEEFSAQDTTTESKTRKFNEALASAKEALNALKEKNEKEAAAATKEAKISNTNENKDYLQNKQKIFDIAPIIESGPYSASNTADTNTNSKHTKMKTASNNINTNKKQSLSRKKKALKHPRYFVNLATTRINDEVKYYYNHSKRWSQRVILEILYHQLRGIELHDTEVLENAFKNSLSGNLDQIDMDLPQFGFTEHPITGESIPFAMEVEKKLETWTSANSHECDWEGIACGFNHFNINRKEALKGMSVEEKEAYHERAEAKVKYNYQDCFCMEPELLKQITEEDVYAYDDDDYFDDDDDDDLYDGECNCPEGYITKREQPEGAVTHVILDGTDFIAFELPPDLANLPFLKSLVLIDNKFTGTMPTEFGSFRNLHELHLEGLFLKGDLPKELSMLNNTLESLILRDCNLSGKFPKALLSLTNLVRLDLSMNHFSGTIPSRISKMKNLEYLDLGKNDFFGTIPTAFGGLTNLKHLHFDHNSLHGNLPEELFSLRKLESINVEWNSFKGSFPQRIDKFKKLKRLVIGNNKFSGTLPENGWTGYEIISARKNSISGTIPKKIFSSTLKVLDLSQNELYGTIPKLSSSKKLNELYIDENNFSGDIDVLAVLPNETTIALEKNK